MNQKFSVSLFSGGLPIFLATATEMLAGHNDWKYLYETPLGFIHALVLGASFIALVVGAIGIQLPRGAEHTHADRASDQLVSADSPDGTVTTITTTKETQPFQEKKP